MDHLLSKINKYLIEIITDYAIIDRQKIITKELKTRISKGYAIDESLTVEDIIVKANNDGCKGFKISLNMINHIEYLDSISDDSILITIDRNSKFYCFKGDKRDLYFKNINDLDNVIIVIIETLKN